MKTRYGSSPWIHTFPASRVPSYPRLRGDLTADVLIVGGGLTGCATAYVCANAGVRPVVIEAERLAQGASGHATGLMLPDPGPQFRDVVAVHGLRAGRQIFETWRRAALDSAALVRRLGIKAAMDRHDVITLAVHDDRPLRKEVDARAAAGLDGRWLNQRASRQLARADIAAAMRGDDGFSLDPYRATLAIAAAAAKRGATVFERTPMTKVRVGRKEVEVVVDGGVVRTPTVVIATGTLPPAFKALRRHLTPRHVYHAMTEPVPAAVRKQMPGADWVVRDTDDPPHRIRWTRDDRLVISGGDQNEVPARARAAALVQRTGQLMYELLKLYPAISGLMPEFGWDALYGRTGDGLPYIGPHRNFPHHLFAVGGGDSLTGAFLAARIIGRAVAGTPDRSDELFGWTR